MLHVFVSVCGSEKGVFGFGSVAVAVRHNSLANQLVVINSCLSVAKHAGRAGLTLRSVPVGSGEIDTHHVVHTKHWYVQTYSAGRIFHVLMLQNYTIFMNILIDLWL